MQTEHDCKSFPFDESIEASIEKMKSEGWRQQPGFMPIVIFPVYRNDATKAESAVAAQQTAGFGGVMGGHIDDSKVHIIRAGDKK